MVTEAGSPGVNAPSSTQVRTFLIADVRGYTRFTVEHGDEGAAQLATRFAEIVEQVTAEWDGRVVELRGDEALAVFSSSRAALRAAVRLQHRFAEEGDGPAPFEVGIGLDAGEAVPVKDGFRGAALNLAARLCSLAGPGEVLASEALIHLARKIDGIEYTERGTAQLKGFTEPVKVVQVRRAGENERASGGPTGGDVASRSEPGELPTQHLPIGGFLGALPSTALVGRDEEVRRALAVVDAVIAGEGRVLVLAGEAGVGKTRLAQEVTLTVRNRGFLLAAGSCSELEIGTPFYPFLEALAGAYAAAPEDIRSAVPVRWPHLARLLPAYSLPVPARAESNREEQQKVFWAVTGFVQALAARLPLALLLDDLHWADESSVALLQHLGRHTRSHRVLLLGTYRDVEVHRHHPLDAALLNLGRQELLERIVLKRLPVEGTAALMAATLGVGGMTPEFAALLHRHTEGNPFFVQEVLRSLVERGDIYRENGHWTRRALEQIEVPESVRAVVAQRLSRLSEGTQTFLHDVSVLGQTFTFDDLLSLNGRSESDLERALEEAISAGLARDVGRETYAFNHALTRHALYGELSSRRKRRLHRAAGEALERLPGPVRERRLAELALHFQESDDAERALPYTMLAGDRAAAAFAHDDAARYYHAALELARRAGNERAEAEAHEKLGGLLTATIRYREALEMLEPAARLFRSAGDQESEARVVAQIGRVYYSLAMTEEGIGRLEPALAALAAEGSPRALAGLISVLGKLYFARARYADALTTAGRASERARETREGGVLAESQITRGSALIALGDWLEGLHVLEDSIGIAESAGDVFSVCRTLQTIAAVHLVRGDLESNGTSLEHALRLAEQMHNQRQIAAITMGLSLHNFVAGAWPRAHEQANRAADVMSALGATWHSTFHLVGLAALAVAEGNMADAGRFLSECLEAGGATGDVQTHREAQAVLAHKELEEGKPEHARVRLEALLEERELVRDDSGAVTSIEPGMPGYLVMTGTYHATGVLPLLGRSYLLLGKLTAALTLANAGREDAKEHGLSLALVEWNGIRGACFARQRRWDEAEEALHQALELARSVPYPYAEARMLYELGRMHRDRGESVAAREHLLDGLAIFRRLGAMPNVKRTDDELVSLR